MNLVTVPPAVFELSSLVRLDLSSNELTSLPKDIARLGKLEHLWLNDNPLAAVPAELARCRRLRFLDLSDTKVATLPNEVGRMKAMVEVDTRNTPLEAALARASKAGTSTLVTALHRRDREAQLRIQMESKLREGVRECLSLALPGVA